MTKADVKTYQLRIPSQSDNLELIREVVGKISKKVGFDDEEASKIELAVDEACANVIKHAYERDQKKPIEIVVKIEFGKLTIIITDQGKGFDPEKLKQPDMKEYLAEMRVGGLGIFLMETLMDEVNFKSSPGKGNQVRMVKYLVEQGKPQKKSKHGKR